MTYAQKNALSQDGNSKDPQETEQSQFSEQNDQVLSGDISALSGNNLLCQDLENSVTKRSTTNLCIDDGITFPTENRKIKILLDSTEIPSCEAKNICNHTASHLYINQGTGLGSRIFDRTFTFEELRNSVPFEINLPPNNVLNLYYNAFKPLEQDYEDVRFILKQSSDLPCRIYDEVYCLITPFSISLELHVSLHFKGI